MNRAQFVSVIRSLALLSATSASVLACSSQQAATEGNNNTVSSGNGTQSNNTNTTTTTTTTNNQNVSHVGPPVNTCEGLDGKNGCTLTERCNPPIPGQKECVCTGDGDGGTVWACYERRYPIVGPLSPPELAA